MTAEYELMTRGSLNLKEAVLHSKNLTKYVQDDFAAAVGLQRPAFAALRSDFKNGIYFGEELTLQFYYLYERQAGKPAK